VERKDSDDWVSACRKFEVLLEIEAEVALTFVRDRG